MAIPDTNYMDIYGLTPGVLDPIAKQTFTIGGCGALAIAIHDATGWVIVAITDHHNVYDNHQAGGGSALHWCVKQPNGLLVDIDGAHDPDELTEKYHDEADDGKAAWGVSCREDVVEWYVECQGEPVPIETATQFVEVVLKRAAEKKNLNAK